jgi:RIO kinase 1
MIELEKILKEYEQKSYQLQNPKQIKSGKEATVFVVSNRDETLALKVYIDPEHRSFKDTSNYLEGKYFRSSSQKRALIKGNKYGKKLLHKNWVRREFFLLQELHQLGANVPEVYALTEDSILMQFIGDETVAPQLISIDLTEKQKMLWNLY